LENLNKLLKNKRVTAMSYRDYFNDKPYLFFEEPSNCKSNYWLNTIIMKDKDQRDLFLRESNSRGVMTRPLWTVMSKLNMYQDAHCSELNNTYWFEDRVVNIPSSYN